MSGKSARLYEHSLTKKESAFIDAYFSNNLSLTAAAKQAGYSGTNTTLCQTGRELLQRPHVKAAIDEILEATSVHTKEIAMRLSEQARGAWSDYLDSTGAIDLPRMISDGKGYLIQSITQNPRGGAPSVKFSDSQRALEILGRVHKLFDNDVKLNTEITLKVQYGSETSE